MTILLSFSNRQVFIQFAKSELKLDEIQKGEVSEAGLQSHEKSVIKHIRNWINNNDIFSFHTSGSTGKPKNIKIPRAKIEYSAKATMDQLDPDRRFTSALLCMNPEMIGGAMVVFRALIFNLNLRVLKPSATPFDQLKPNESYDLTSLVPLQLHSSTAEQINHCHHILVGGSELTVIDKAVKSTIYATFGMTETVSHFALRKLPDDHFTCVGDAKLLERADSRLSILGTITDQKPLVSNDIVEYLSDSSFMWKGRSDFVINSGGVKIHPEEVERKLKSTIQNNFIIASLPDDKLGERVILIIEGKSIPKHLDFLALSKYEVPKEVYYLDEFVLAESGKINRRETKNKLIISVS